MVSDTAAAAAAAVHFRDVAQTSGLIRGAGHLELSNVTCALLA